ncbi:winged helix-turn-helix domain-containing protein [Actinocatenispora sera]|uniref:winged helix-turn-helix domain-containing protein n=1 Tax=Actinocatenispora sera TaxID=390989 RepID=UPI0034078357
MPRWESITRGAPSPVYRQLARVLAESIDAGEYSPAQKLPSESDIQQLTGIAPMTTRKAFRLLAERGRARTIPARGTFVEPVGDLD